MAGKRIGARHKETIFASNIQADVVALDDSRHKIVDLPYPLMLKQETAATVRSYVEKGGTLVGGGLKALHQVQAAWRQLSLVRESDMPEP
ncbi:MAG: hypothetical protein M3Y07_01875 [Acidobacteriota bacterium]|nr:hypothetical protein [Acidobacteriota bacterium]